MIKSKNYLKFFVIITRTFHKRLAILFILTIIVSLLDVFSIGSLWPLLNYVTQSEFNNNLNYNFLNYFKNEINNDNLLKIICGIILFLFLAKNIFIYIYAKFNTNLLSYLTIYHQEIILQNILKKKWDFFLRKNSAELIREFNTDIRELNANFIQPIFSKVLGLWGKLVLSK